MDVPPIAGLERRNRWRTYLLCHLVNNGTIGSAGTALEFGYSGNFYNESGAIVRGGMAAVRQSSVYPGSGGSLFPTPA
jgi:hypothetical protein